MLALVLGGAGFIGGHLASRLKSEGHEVVVADIKYPEFTPVQEPFYKMDLACQAQCERLFSIVINQHGYPNRVYQLAADMGGAEYIFSGNNDAKVMANSAAINLNVAACVQRWCGQSKVFYSSSACCYSQDSQHDPNHPGLREDMAYPANPDSEYGWEKLFSERLWLAYARNHEIDVRIARFHNVAGEMGTWQGGREKAPAAIARKVAEAPNGGEIEIFGDGCQTRSFLHVSDCLDGIEALMQSSFAGPVNIGSEEQVSINQLAQITMEIAGKNLSIKHIPGPLGVRGRNSHNALMKEKTGWSPKMSLRDTVGKIYPWVSEQVAQARGQARIA